MGYALGKGFYKGYKLALVVEYPSLSLLESIYTKDLQTTPSSSLKSLKTLREGEFWEKVIK